MTNLIQITEPEFIEIARNALCGQSTKLPPLTIGAYILPNDNPAWAAELITAMEGTK